MLMNSEFDCRRRGRRRKNNNKKAAEVKRVFLCSKFINKNKNDVIRPATALSLSRNAVFRFLFAAMFVFIPKQRNIVETCSLFSGRLIYAVGSCREDTSRLL